jgi:type IV secretion system protein VirB1
LGISVIPAALLACALNVAPATLQAIISVESGGDPLALHVNDLRVQPSPSRDAQQAAQLAASYITRGYTVDLGLMQVNSRNLAALGLSVAQVLDPCTNIRGGAAILTADYAEAVQSRGNGQVALQAALSAYNTGDFYRGFTNGYVARYYGPGGVPRLAGGLRPLTGPAASAPQATRATAPDPFTADTSVFVREASNVRIE